MESPIAAPGTRRSRWARDPVLQVDGRPSLAQLTERDFEIFGLLARYRYLSADDIHAFVGGSLKALTRRLNLLSRKPNLYINRPQQQRQTVHSNCRRLIYELDDKGIGLLRDRGLPHLPKSYHRNFAHELLVCRIMASFEHGARRCPSIRLVTWQEIMASDHTPLATRNSSSPASISISFTYRGEDCSIKLTADARPFGLERTNPDGSRAYFFFPGIEADCGTEPIEASDLDRSSLLKKFVAYRAVAEQALYKSHFGFPNFLVPIVTTSAARMRSMMTLLQSLTSGRGSRMFLFKTLPSLASFGEPALPPGAMLLTPWQRAGFEALDFTQ
jgi:hypothetical protein